MTEKQAQKWIAERDQLGKELKRLEEQFIKKPCPKCGVSSDFHQNFYCRMVESLLKSNGNLRQEIAELKQN